MDTHKEAFAIVLQQGGGEGWYTTSTLQLQLASLELCIICRGIRRLSVRVGRDSPAGIRSLTDLTEPPQTRRSKRRASSRVPPVLPARLTLDLPSTHYAWSRLVFPALLRQLSYGREFNRRIAGVVWPASLQQISFGYNFNQPIDGVVWPASLQQISFGYHFNQPIDGVAWTASLQQISFGYNFNQPIDGVVWPASLQQISFGCWFNQPIAGVVWPASLQQI